MSGLFVENIDWTDPQFAPWHLKNLGTLNEAQLDAFFDDDDVDLPELTEDEIKEMCLQVPCRVELERSNVCRGVERGWPKRMFNKATFEELKSKKKRHLYRKMEEKAVELYNQYVDLERLERRRQRHTKRAYAYYYEAKYVKNRFLRIQALGIDNENTSEFENSQQTVINTGTLRKEEMTNKDNGTHMDLNDNNVNDENIPNNLQSRANVTVSKRSSIHQQRLNESVLNEICIIIDSVGTQKASNNVIYDVDASDEGTTNIDEDDDNSKRLGTDSDKYNDLLTESFSASTNQESELNEQLESYLNSPQNSVNDFITNTDAIAKLRQNRMNILSTEDDESEQPDSLDFLSQGIITAMTSTQQ